MKSISISIKSKNNVISNAEEALSFVRSVGVNVEGNMLNIFQENFQCFLDGKQYNSNGGRVSSFAIGGNSCNPSVYLRDITNVTSKAELKKFAENAIQFALKELKPIIKDLELNLRSMDDGQSYTIDGGFLKYWAQSQNRHFFVYEVFIKSDITSVEYIVDQIKVVYNNYLKNSKKGQEDVA